jgi:hypothetical protein
MSSDHVKSWVFSPDLSLSLCDTRNMFFDHYKHISHRIQKGYLDIGGAPLDIPWSSFTYRKHDDPFINLENGAFISSLKIAYSRSSAVYKSISRMKPHNDQSSLSILVQSVYNRSLVIHIPDNYVSSESLSLTTLAKKMVNITDKRFLIIEHLHIIIGSHARVTIDYTDNNSHGCSIEYITCSVGNHSHLVWMQSPHLKDTQPSAYVMKEHMWTLSDSSILDLLYVHSHHTYAYMKHHIMMEGSHARASMFLIGAHKKSYASVDIVIDDISGTNTSSIQGLDLIDTESSIIYHTHYSAHEGNHTSRYDIYGHKDISSSHYMYDTQSDPLVYSDSLGDIDSILSRISYDIMGVYKPYIKHILDRSIRYEYQKNT